MRIHQDRPEWVLQFFQHLFSTSEIVYGTGQSGGIWVFWDDIVLDLIPLQSTD